MTPIGPTCLRLTVGRRADWTAMSVNILKQLYFKTLFLLCNLFLIKMLTEKKFTKRMCLLDTLLSIFYNYMFLIKAKSKVQYDTESMNVFQFHSFLRFK